MTPASGNAYPAHGGDLAAATRLYGKPEAAWLDLSTGINPHAYPAPPVDTASYARLPDPGELALLLATARDAYSVPAGVGLVAVPGSELAIRLLPSLGSPGPAAVFRQTYASHADAFVSAGRDVVRIARLEDIPAAIATVILANPNNPDGTRHAPEALAALAHRLATHGGRLIVDEAFTDVAPELSLMPQLGHVPAIVLRSFGKFFGLPGLRLGFVAGPADIVARLESLVGAWPINAAALAIAPIALADTRWQHAMRAQLAAEADMMRALLTMHGLKIAGAIDLFTLVAHDDAAGLHAHLARYGIWTRIFAENPDAIRVGLAPPGPALARLDAALGARAR